MTVVARFQIEYTRYVDHTGRIVQPLPAFAPDARALIDDYRAMVLMRALDAKAIALQRTGQIGTYASTLGKEAIDAGVVRLWRATTARSSRIVSCRCR